MQGGWLYSQPHDMILGKMKQCGAQANAACCISHRSALQRATQRTAFVASPFCSAHSFRYAKTIHPARCIRPFTFERPRSRLPQSRKRLKGGKATASPTSQKPIGLECPQTLPDGGRSIILFPGQAPQKPRLRASFPVESPKDAAGRMIGPEELFGHVLGSQ